MKKRNRKKTNDMKLRKTLFSLILAFCLCFALAAPAWAEDEFAYIYEARNIEVNGYSFDIMERVNDEDLTIVKTYINSVSFTNELDLFDIDRAKALLIAIGFDEGALALWSDETILDFANAERITTSIAYYTFDEENNSAIQLAEDLVNSPNNDIEPGVYNDGYIKVYNAAAHKGSGEYLFSTDSLWLSMPKDRGYDSISVSSPETYIDLSTAKGSWSCFQTYVVGEEVTENYISNANFVKTEGPIMSDWTGVAAVFRLPVDGASEDVSVKYEDFRTHYQYNGGIRDYTSAKNFTSLGIYSHARQKLSFVPTLNVSANNVGLGITLNSQWNPVNYPATFVEKYNPGK